MTIRSVAHRVLLKVPEAGEKRTAGGIILDAGTDTFRKTQAATKGVILDIGPDVVIGKEQLKVGDEVHFVAYGGVAIYDGEENVPTLRMVNDEDIYGKVE